MELIVGPAPDPATAGDPPDVRAVARPAKSDADVHPGLAVARALLAEPQPLAHGGLSHRAAGPVPPPLMPR
jgi:hypothetical protein